MKHYLVIQLARFGDLIQTKRLLKTLCARPGAVVHLCVDVSLSCLASLVFPDVIVHEIKAHGTGLKGAEVLRAMLIDNRQAFSKLSSIVFDEVYNLNFSPLNFRLAALFDSDCVRGYAWENGQELISPWAAMAMRWSRQRRLGINLVDFWAAYAPDMIAPELVNPKALPKGNGMGVVLSGRESRRSLPLDVLSRLVTVMVQKEQVQQIYLLGSQGEHGAGQQLLKNLSGKVAEQTTNVAGKTNWADLIEIVKGLDCLVTPDTGTMHLASHLGTPVQAFFLSSAWCFETGPYGIGHRVYQALTGCLPCLETMPCMYDVKCSQCFRRPEFQRYLVTQKEEHAPRNLLVFDSSFDALGQTYTPIAGQDKDADERTQFRSFLLQYLSGDGGAVTDSTQEIAQRLYREKDWIAYNNDVPNLGI